jgi:hypothetical protein
VAEKQRGSRKARWPALRDGGPPRDLVASYTKPLAAGSYLILSMGVASEAAEKFFRLYSGGPSKLCQHTPGDFASFFGPLQLLPPGTVDARAWRPGGEDVPAPAP